jgi:hypothetical protein
MRIINWFTRLFGIGQTPHKIVNLPPLSENPGVYRGHIECLAHERAMVEEAIDLCDKVIRSPYFIDEVLRAKFTGTNGKSNAEILDLFVKRAHRVNVKMFTGTFMQNRVYHTVGYDSASDDFVHANRYFVKDAERLASLIMHECLGHGLGFSHESANDHNSVPYSLNRISESVMEKIGGTSGHV